MRFILLGALVWCGCRAGGTGDDTDPVVDKDADTDTDTDADADSDTDSDSDSDVDTHTGRDGIYTNAFTLTFEEWGVAAWSTTCEVPLSLTVELGGIPQVSGQGTCTLSGQLSGDVDLALTGVALVDDITGVLAVTRYGQTHPSTWTGAFVGTDGLDGTFDDSFSQGSGGLRWAGSFQLTR